ncbi:MAG: HlyD family efflux transporter periplasmic adaptor subunit, partial [Eubacteriales bacterium]|nr:HlyD family efflux transporter periplasmic adaptor subunit [Eubacteriales bacterium]
MQNGYGGQWTPEQIAAWQAAQLGMTPEQYAAWQAQQSGQWTPDQYAAWQAQQGAQMTPEQYAAWQAQQMWTPPEPSMQPPQAGMSQEEAMQYQLGMTPEQVRQWKKAKKAARKAGKAKKHGGFRRALRIALIVAVIGAGGWYVWQQTRSTAPTTAVIQLGTLGTTYRGDALIVRDETVYDDESVQSIEYVAEEGSTVYRGDVVCYVYSTGYSSREMSTLQDYRDQIKDYQRTLLQ